MFKKLKIKHAARRVQSTRKPATKKNTRRTTRRTFWSRVWGIICWPFRMIAKLCRRLWQWVCSLDVVGLVNITLLVAIIVLFSMLIIDIVGCRRNQIVVVAEPVPVTHQVSITDAPAPRSIKPRQQPTLPMRVDTKTNKKVEPAINVVPVKKSEVQVVKQQTATVKNRFWGDIIIDSRGAGAMLQNGAQVNGNLYLQNMRKYTLPCDIRINGNLFLRDVNMLQFCGDFIITGNIYVSPRSSFGPIPKTARLGGHVIL